MTTAPPPAASQTEIEEADPEDAAEEAEPEEEAEADGEEAEPAPAAKPPSRAARRIQSLNERLEKAERELEEVKRRPAAPDPAAAAAAQAREKAEEDEVNLSGDTARIAQFYSGRAERRAEARFEGLARHVVDSSDRTTFAAACASNPTLASIADEVERQLVTYRAQGGNPQRLFVARLILGERVEQRAKGAKTRQGKRAAADIQRQTARPGAARSDVQTGRKRQDSHEARAKRLDESGQL